MLLQDNIALTYALKYSDSVEVALKDKNSLLSKKINLQIDVVTTHENTISNLTQQLKIEKKIYRRKKFFAYVKGIGIGAAALSGIILITR